MDNKKPANRCDCIYISASTERRYAV